MFIFPLMKIMIVAIGELKINLTVYRQGGWNSYHKSPWEQPIGTKILPGRVIDTTGYLAGSTYMYEFTCMKSGFDLIQKPEHLQCPPHKFTQKKN